MQVHPNPAQGVSGAWDVAPTWIPTWSGVLQEPPGAAVPTLPPRSHGPAEPTRPIKEGRAGCDPPAAGGSGMLHPVPFLGCWVRGGGGW